MPKGGQSDNVMENQKRKIDFPTCVIESTQIPLTVALSCNELIFTYNSDRKRFLVPSYSVSRNFSALEQDVEGMPDFDYNGRQLSFLFLT